MTKKKRKLLGKLAVGIFVDGLYVRVACLLKQKDKIRIIDAQNVALAGHIETIETEDEIVDQNIDFSSDNAISLDITDNPKSEQSKIKVDAQGNLSQKISKPLQKESSLTFTSAESTSVTADDVTKGSDDSIEMKASSEVLPIDLEFLLDTSIMDDTMTELSSDDPMDAKHDIEFLSEPEMETAEPGENSTEVNTIEKAEESAKEEAFDLNADDITLIESDPIDITEEIQERSFSQTKKITSKEDNVSIMIGILNKYPSRKYELAISLPEPQVYYSYFDRNWGLKGRKLKQRIISELFKERSDSEVIKPDAISTLSLANDNLLAIVRDAEIGILNLLQTVDLQLDKRLPKISVVESAEISLINLIKKNYSFEENEITVVVFVGNDFSRLIFMKGNELYHISPIIGEGIESFLVFGHSLTELGNTIHSRLLLEQDDLNLSTVHRIILTGDACRAEIKNILKSWFSDDIKIEELQYSNIEVHNASPTVLKNLQQVPIAVGAALRALEGTNKNLYSINLIPTKIKEGQKVFKLGPLGWLFLVLIPILTFYSTTNIRKLSNEVKLIETIQLQKKSELSSLREIEALVQTSSEKLSYYKQTFGVLDSMVVGSQTMSHFLKNLSHNARKIGSIWLTELSISDNCKAQLKGYSLLRHKIPLFSNAIGKATLNQVKVEEIRGRTVYYFEISADVPQKD